MKRGNLFLYMVIGVLLVINIIFVYAFVSGLRPSLSRGMLTKRKSFLDCPQQLEYANLLFSKNLKEASALAFEDYLESCPQSNKESAVIFQKVGDIYADTGTFDKALFYFYKADMLDKELGRELSPKIVSALQKLGLSDQAKRESNERASFLNTTSEAGGKIVARIGDDEIGRGLVDQRMSSLPQDLLQTYSTPEGRQELLWQIVTQEVLYKKAKRLGIDKDPHVTQLLDDATKQIIVQKLVEQEVLSKVAVTDEEVKQYYDANKERFVQDEAINIGYVTYRDEKDKDAYLARLESAPDQDNIWVPRSQTTIPGIGEAKEVIDSLFVQTKGYASDAIKVGDAFYIFKINNKVPRTHLSFDNLKNRLTTMYTAQKQRVHLDDYVRKAMEEEEVEIYPE